MVVLKNAKGKRIYPPSSVVPSAKQLNPPAKKEEGDPLSLAMEHISRGNETRRARDAAFEVWRDTRDRITLGLSVIAEKKMALVWDRLKIVGEIQKDLASQKEDGGWRGDLEEQRLIRELTKINTTINKDIETIQSLIDPQSEKPPDPTFPQTTTAEQHVHFHGIDEIKALHPGARDKIRSVVTGLVEELKTLRQSNNGSGESEDESEDS